MELDFSDKIRQLGLQKSKSAEEIQAGMDMQTKKDNPEMAMQNKSVCKICGMKWGSCAHANDMGNMMEEGPDHENKETPEDEKTEDSNAAMECKDCNCGKSSSECTCSDCTSKSMQKSDSAKEMKHPDKEDKKDVQSEKGKPTAEKEEEKKKFPFNKSKASTAEKIVQMLEAKIKTHNEKYETLLTFAQLNKVYSRGLEVFKTTHRPKISLHQWAMARVNLFFKMMAGVSVNQKYSFLDSDIAKTNSDTIVESGLDSYDFIEFSDLEFQLAKISLVEAGLSEYEMNSEISYSEEKKNK
jgi:hypothetical protein